MAATRILTTTLAVLGMVVLVQSAFLPYPGGIQLALIGLGVLMCAGIIMLMGFSYGRK